MSVLEKLYRTEKISVLHGTDWWTDCDDLAAVRILCRAHRAGLIAAGESFPALKVNAIGKLSSSVVNKSFYPLFVHAKKFWVKPSCLSCGLCAGVCPLKNISYDNNKRPLWGDNCTHCMACINRCPAQAIEYGHKSKNQRRYLCPKEL